MTFTRRRNSKRLQFRGGGGRYARATLESAFGFSACVDLACGRFFQSVVMKDDGPFPEKVRITVCPHCGTDQTKEPGTSRA